MYYPVDGKLSKKRLILLPKNTILIIDRFYSIWSCDLLWHPNTQQWPLLKSSEKLQGQGDGNGERVLRRVLYSVIDDS